MLKTPSKHNLTHQLTHTLGTAIVNGKYKVGEGLPSEADICIAEGVSRSATREAVKMLSAKGLISSRPKQGIRVLPESSWNMFDTDVLGWILNSKPSLTLLLEFTQVRSGIEPLAGFLAAQVASPEQLSEIEEALQRMIDANDGLDDPLDACISFHAAILKASGNRFFAQLTDFISTALRVSIRYTNRLTGASNTDVSKYKQIYQALVKNDAETASRHLTTLLNSSLSVIEKELQKQK